MSKLILIVDDSESIRNVVGIALRDAGYDVIEACDGKDALEKISGKKVHLIVSDINMPVMDGISFVKAVKKIPDYRFVPVCMLTTESEKAKVMEGKEAGAKAWIVKPFQPPKLLDIISRLVA